MDMEMLHKIEPKIRRMEYRPAFGPLAKAIETFVSDGSADSIVDKGNLDGERQVEVAALTAHLQDLEQQLKDQEFSFQHKLEESTATAFERGRIEEDSSRTTMITKMAESIDHALGEFITVRDHYLAQVEQEVVRLALSIATRILHREVQMDPLLLSGAVRVTGTACRYHGSQITHSGHAV